MRSIFAYNDGLFDNLLLKYEYSSKVKHCLGVGRLYTFFTNFPYMHTLFENSENLAFVLYQLVWNN